MYNLLLDISIWMFHRYYKLTKMETKLFSSRPDPSSLFLILIGSTTLYLGINLESFLCLIQLIYTSNQTLSLSDFFSYFSTPILSSHFPPSSYLHLFLFACTIALASFKALSFLNLLPYYPCRIMCLNFQICITSCLKIRCHGVYNFIYKALFIEVLNSPDFCSLVSGHFLLFFILPIRNL